MLPLAGSILKKKLNFTNTDEKKSFKYRPIKSLVIKHVQSLRLFCAWVAQTP